MAKILRLLSLSLALVFVLKGLLSAEGLFSEDLFHLVAKTPELVEARQNLELSDAEIDFLTSQIKPKINFSTDGNYPITKNLASSNSRISGSDKRYIDGKISLNTRLYDFGFQDELIRSEKFKKSAAVISLQILEQDVYFELLKTGFEIINLEIQARLTSSHIGSHDQDREVIKQRFTQGVGTNIDVKEIEIIGLNVQNEYNRIKFDLQAGKNRFSNRFGGPFERYKPSLEARYHSIQKPGKDFDANKLLIIKKINYEILALEAEASSIAKSNLPVVSSSFSLNMYNMNKRIGDDYSIIGGINMNLPLYDGGVNKSKERKAAAKNLILKTQLLKEKSAKHQKWIENSTKLSRVIEQTKLLQERQAQTVSKYQILEKLSATLKANLMEIIRARVSVREQEREQARLHGALKQAHLENVFLRERLLEGRLK